ncbi:MAG: PspC domain-containing protein [Ekhidna sp.]
MEMTKRLFRSSDKVIGGVCAGLANYFNLDPTLVRAGYLIISILSVAFPGILVYLILWVIMPDQG